MSPAGPGIETNVDAEGVAQLNLMCILNLQPLHKAQSISKPMKRPSAHTDATEHAYDDNTGPRGSDATKRAATMEAMLQSAQLQLK